MVNETKQHLFDLLAEHGGSIVSTNSLHTDLINQARASNRMWVDENSLGYVWEPPFAGRFPETPDEVKMFEWCYPLDVELPESMKTDEFVNRILNAAKPDNPPEHLASLTKRIAELEAQLEQRWISVEEKLPPVNELVWIIGGEITPYPYLGCRVEDDGEWSWATADRVLYIKDGKIDSDCDTEDVTGYFWQPLPPLLASIKERGDFA